jgi:GNAT superfamily N-acetyltransferase
MSAVASRWSALYADAHAARLLQLARHARTRRTDGAFAIVTGAASNVDNGVVCERSAVSPVAVAELVGWVSGQGVPASWICAGVEASDELRSALVNAGCREETTGVTIGAELAATELPPLVAPDGVVVEEVRDGAGLDAWVDVAAACGFFDEPGHLRRQRELLGLAGRHWVARRGGRPVGMATAFFADGVALLEHVAVVADERRCGIGSTLALVRLHEARRLGCTTAVFGTTPESAALYARFGFTTEPDAPGRWFYLP